MCLISAGLMRVRPVTCRSRWSAVTRWDVDLGGPTRDKRRVGAGIQRGAVSRQFLVAGRDCLANAAGFGRVGVVGVLGVGHRLNGGVDAGRVEDLAEPAADRPNEGVFSQADVQRVGDPVGQGVPGGKAQR
jgi:hypothetical protein